MVRGKHAVEQLGAARERAEYLRRREGRVKEQAHPPSIQASVRQALGSDEQVVAMHPNERPLAVGGGDLSRERSVDSLVRKPALQCGHNSREHEGVNTGNPACKAWVGKATYAALGFGLRPTSWVATIHADDVVQDAPQRVLAEAVVEVERHLLRHEYWHAVEATQHRRHRFFIIRRDIRIHHAHPRHMWAEVVPVLLVQQVLVVPLALPNPGTRERTHHPCYVCWRGPQVEVGWKAYPARDLRRRTGNLWQAMMTVSEGPRSSRLLARSAVSDTSSGKLPSLVA